MRTAFRVYQYRITVDGVAKEIEVKGRIDYKTTCRNYYKNGAKSVVIDFLGSYIWEE